jgi:NAD(P)-dependent dehydrogenase (short-subunit alcohol dehydrogenase family)
MNILIVGASKGIGYELAKICLKNGDQVFAISRTHSDLDNIQQIKADVKNLNSADFDFLPDSLDAFVYCPGSINLKPFNRFTKDDFIDDMLLNVWCFNFCVQNILSRLKKSEKSSIVAFSTVAVKIGMPYHSLVSASKGALEGICRSLAAELAPQIRVNLIAPSITDTPLAAKILSTEDKKKSSAMRHPLQSIGEANDIAEMAYFLASTKSKWITGQVFCVDGGLSTIKLL